MHLPKPKNTKRTRLAWVLAVFTTILLAIFLLILAPIMPELLLPKPFATNTWPDGAVICSTDWYFADFEAAQAQLEAAIDASEMDINIVAVDLATGRGYCGNISEFLSELYITVAVSETQLNDTEQLGQILAQILGLISTTELEYPYFILTNTVINIRFSHLQESHIWRVHYQDAQRALAAGLRGAALFAIGKIE